MKKNWWNIYGLNTDISGDDKERADVEIEYATRLEFFITDEEKREMELVEKC